MRRIHTSVAIHQANVKLEVENGESLQLQAEDRKSSPSTPGKTQTAKVPRHTSKGAGMDIMLETVICL